MRFGPSMSAAVSARLEEAGRERSARRSPFASAILGARCDRPATSVTASRPNRCMIWSRTVGTGSRAPSFPISASCGHGLPADDGVPLCIGGGPAHQVALVVGEELLQLYREGVHQEGEDAIPGRQVDVGVVPFGGGDLGDAAFHQRFAARDQLDDGRPPGGEIGLDGADRRGALHAGQQTAEEALLRSLEGGERRRLGIRVQDVSPKTTPVAFSASSILAWITLKAPAQAP